MAVLEKIRVKMGLFIIIIIGIALLSFIIDANTFQSAMSMFSSKYDVGKINGNKISYTEFQKKREYYDRIYQLSTGSSSLNEEQGEMVNESAWQDFITDYILIPNIKSAGIDVGEDELFDLAQGSQISPVLMREPAFAGADGMFSREALVQFIRSIPSDQSRSLATYWDYLEKNIVVEQMFSKYISLIGKSTFQTPRELMRSIDDNNITSDISFVMVPYSFVADTTVTVNSEEVRNYYNKHKHTFERTAGRDIEYVVFEVLPSIADVELARADIEKAYDEFAFSDNLKAFLVRNSDKQLDPYYYKEGELVYKSFELDSFAFHATEKDIFPIHRDGDIFRAARINSIKQMPDSVFVDHILLDSRVAGVDTEADSLLNLLNRGADFSELASINSLDQNPNLAPGEIGWMTQTYMIPGFDTCFIAAPGKPFKLQSTYGLHIIKVRERTKPIKKVQLAILEKGATAGRETFQTYYTQANELASKSAGKFENYNNTVREMNLSPVPAVNIAPNAKSIAAYPNARELVRWAYEAKRGDVSQIISIDNKYFFVATLTGIRDAGIPSVEELSFEISTIIKKEKSDAKMVAEIKTQIEGLTDIESVAEKLGTTVSTQSGIAFGAASTMMMDPKFIGAAASASENRLTGPIGGSIAAYVFKVHERNTGAFFTEDDAKTKQLQAVSYQIQMIPYIMEKAAGVVDNRAKFF